MIVNLNHSLLKPDLILIGLEASSAEEAMRLMADVMFQKGYVKESFIQSLLEREAVHPTGIPTPIPVGLPHTGIEHCIQPGVCIGILKSPVIFGMIGAPEQRLSTRLIFMLSIVNPAEQVEMLQKVVDFFQKTDRMQALLNAQTALEAFEIVKKGLFLEER
ncbi:MAG: PTS sugar transporter subunit IIA [Anaerolineales bacterium]|nr:PTS sugar transporter subunit IIA [Anaerolineales bacterium]MCX7608485.1 PTS sugar transporter subunit IIA [Anaerolineales bacterium]MDW8226925.1 PTS sugar transporter subunit IIA [Anaerolineales bacterium]